MKYQNTVTGAVVESASPIQGKYWVEIKENRITDISFYSAVEDDCAYIKQIISDDVIPLLNNRGLFIDYGKKIISIL